MYYVHVRTVGFRIARGSLPLCVQHVNSAYICGYMAIGFDSNTMVN